MRRVVCFLVLTVCLMACGTYRSLDLSRLTTGMTKAEVEKIAGFPDRILAVNETREGYQEILEYRTSRGEIYALEFWDDFLMGYEYLYDDIQYVPSPYPPAVFPPYGRPIYVYPGNRYRPGSVNRPNNNRPNNNNNSSNSNNNNSGINRPANRPSRENQSNRETQSNSNNQNSGTGSNRTNSRTNRAE